MKKIVLVVLASIFAGLALNAQAATLTFDPSVVELTVTPGESGRTSLTVYGFSEGPYSLNFTVGSRLGSGNIPLEWLAPAYAMLISRTGGASSSAMDLVVNVPPEAMPGTYTGVLVPEFLRSSEPTASDGFILAIEVTGSGALCSGLPVFTDVRIGPQNVWAPSDRDVAIDITGAVSLTEGCEATARYVLESNNGPVQGNLDIGADGNFAERVMVNVSRSGTDKDGKAYNGKLYAAYTDGNEVTLEFTILVLHDKGQKVGQNK